jgi:hypothetical protein
MKVRLVFHNFGQANHIQEFKEGKKERRKKAK